MEKRDTATGRKLYQKPQVNQVKLMIQEAVLAVCKLTTGVTPGHDACTTFPLCTDIGS